jgi:DNA polymerase-3 subunit gamma/tau
MIDNPGGDAAPDRPETDEPSFLGLAGVPDAPTPYRVLARKYRPQTFTDLIGQEAMVRTVSNAFATNRIPQAWMLTGVRGVGKTTTARILARALNYEVPGRVTAPTIDMAELGTHCRAIMESRHIDVLEMDAASHTGVENIRQITDAVRYSPAQARYKVYIIDEVHMLSTAAFNAFLKTLEEPPPHAKFVFATTEIRKVPVTILSRCQRFDLRRVGSATLVAHLERICLAEAVTAEPDALATIARAAEGSVRDSLSLLDQAVAHGAGTVSAEAVRDMLGLADRNQVIDLFEAVMRGDVPRTFAILRSGWEAGADPAQMVGDLATFTHLVTRMKLAPDAAKDPALTEAERLRGSEFARTLSVRTLSRAWQILSKAAPEIGASQRPLPAAEMALVRLAYAADLPTPDEVLRQLQVGQSLSVSPPSLPVSQPMGNSGGGGAALAVAPRPASVPRPEPEGVTLRRFEDVVAMAGEKREIGLKTALEQDVRLVAFEDGRIELSLVEGAPATLPHDLGRALNAWTGRRWVITVSTAAGGATVAEERQARERERRHDAASHPLVQAVLSSFPGAEIVDVRDRAPPPEVGAEPNPLPAEEPDIEDL